MMIEAYQLLAHFLEQPASLLQRRCCLIIRVVASSPKPTVVKRVVFLVFANAL